MMNTVCPPRIIVGAVFAILLVLSGCDLAEETIFLDRDVRFTFMFDGGDISPEGVITSVETVDFQGDLDGFRKEDIIQASVVTVQVSRHAPPGMDLDQIMSSVDLVLENGQQQTVATQSAFSSNQSMPLDIANGDVTSHTRAQDGFQAELDVAASENLEEDQQYTLHVDMNISLELEGI